MVEPRQQPQDQFDRGRSWLVLLGAFITGACVMGNTLTLSTLSQAVVDRVQQHPKSNTTSLNGSAGQTHGQEPSSSLAIIMLFATVPAVASMTGVLGSFLTNIIGYKVTIASGTVIAMLGFGLSALATRLWHMYLTMGLLAGTGLGITFIPAQGVLSFYFSRKYFNFAGSVAATSVATGIFAYSYIHPGLVGALQWSSAMLVEAALCALLFVSALVIREADVVAGSEAGREKPEEAEKLRQRRKKHGFLEPQSSVSSTRTTIFEMSAIENSSAVNPDHDFCPPSSLRGRAYTTASAKTNAKIIRSKTPKKRLSLQNNSLHNNDAGSKTVIVTNETAPETNGYVNYGQDMTGESVTAKTERSSMPSLLVKPRLRSWKIKSPFVNKRSASSTVRVDDSAHSLPAAETAKKRIRVSVMKHLFPSELMRNTPFYLIMLECSSMLTTDLFLILTPSYLVGSQHWSNIDSASRILTVFGGVSLATRIALSLFNCRPSLARRIPISLQIGVGIVLVAVASSVFLSASSASTDSLVGTKRSSWLQEPNAWLFAVFAGVCGVGGTLINAYQGPLMYEFVPKRCYTTALAFESVLIGVFILAFCPLPGVFEQAFGTLRYGYTVCLGFCFVSLTALISIAVLSRLRTKNQRPQSANGKTANKNY